MTWREKGWGGGGGAKQRSVWGAAGEEALSISRQSAHRHDSGVNFYDPQLFSFSFFFIFF